MKDAVQFLLSMEDVRQFLNAYLKDPSTDRPIFNIKVDFRTARNKESGGNIIVDWYIKTDEITTIDKHDKKTEGTWSFGGPITVGFRWPETGTTPKPTSDSGQSSLKVEGSTAEFVYDSQWALLWLIRDHIAPKGSFSKVTDPNPYVLKFSVPLTDQTFTTVYNSISLVDPSSKPKGPSKIITMPTFPTSAPDLPEKTKEIKNKPVLTDGTIEAVDFGVFVSEKKEDTKEDKPKEKAGDKEQEEDDVSEEKRKKSQVNDGRQRNTNPNFF
jgi:type VI secretion system protein ImpL